MPDRKPLTQHGFLELPVTRDLSASKLGLINKWFDLGMHEG